MNDYQIKYRNIKEGSHFYEFNIDNSFFNLFNNSEVTDADITVDVILEKKTGKEKMTVNLYGEIHNLLCDLCSTNISVKISSKTIFLIEISEEKKNSLDDILYVNSNTNVISIKDLLYELIILAIPNRKIHSKNKNGKRKCDKEMLKLIEDYSFKKHVDEDRWSELKKIKLNEQIKYGAS